MHAALLSLVLLSLMNCIYGMFICKSDGMFENIDDPNTFWHCSNGINYLKNCPAPLVWSQELQQCSWRGKSFETT